MNYLKKIWVPKTKCYGKYVYKTKNTDKNNELVKVINSGLIDLKLTFRKCPEIES